MADDHRFDHSDNLDFLNRNAPLREKLIATHRTVQQELPFIARIALTLYDTETRVLPQSVSA